MYYLVNGRRKVLLKGVLGVRFRVMVFNGTFNNISVITWRPVDWWSKPEYPKKTTDLPQITDEGVLGT